jgi:hypothetical protein
MPNSTRIVVAVVFFAIMTFVVNPMAHAVVNLGFVPWLLWIAGFLWIGIAIENRRRRKWDEPSYSWHDVGQDARAIVPFAAGWGCFVLAIIALTKFI